MKNRVVFQRVADDNDMPTVPGTYRRIVEYWADYVRSKGSSRKYWAELCCPTCGRVALLGDNHDVLPDGTVTPSDVCPFDAKWLARHGLRDQVACTFHRYVHLADWARTSTPRRDA